MSLAYEPVAEDAQPTFPPLLSGRLVRAGVDPFEKAVAAAAAGEDAGAVYHAPGADALRAAIVFAPEGALSAALPMLMVCGCGLVDALGALGPPELGVRHVWPDGVTVNGAWCGAWRAASDARDPREPADWLVIGLTLSLRLPDGLDPGATPGVTALAEEGCAELPRVRILESWARHVLTWTHRFEADGPRPIFDAWLARVESRGEEVAFAHDGAIRRGVFSGLDEAGDMILRTPEGTELAPLSAILDAPRVWPPAELDAFRGGRR